MMRPPHNSAQTMYHQMHGLRQYMHLNQTQQMLQQQANQSIQANQSMPMPHNTFSPPQSISLSARDKTINWLSEAENQSPSPPSMANTHAPPNTGMTNGYKITKHCFLYWNYNNCVPMFQFIYTTTKMLCYCRIYKLIISLPDKMAAFLSSSFVVC